MAEYRYFDLVRAEEEADKARKHERRRMLEDRVPSARDLLDEAASDLRTILSYWPIENESRHAIAAQNALDLVETALYWLESYNEV